MKKESMYYAIINEGEEKRVENWSKAEVLDWLRTIKHERMDLKNTEKGCINVGRPHSIPN